MEKEFEKLMDQAHKVIIEHACWEAGCSVLFGNENIADVKQAIVDKGAEELIKKTTWSFAPTTKDGYDEWVFHKVRWDDLPSYISRAAYLDGFRHQLTAQYLKEKKAEESKHEENNG